VRSSGAKFGRPSDKRPTPRYAINGFLGCMLLTANVTDIDRSTRSRTGLDNWKDTGSVTDVQESKTRG
jgi:hypothetical protein